ncbi:LIM domain only protein 7 isoform 3-T3 [Menidia menidia]
MEWREQSSVGCVPAYVEAHRWIEAVTKKKFGSNDFRSALENGVLLCELINKIKPGIIKKVNRLPTPIAGLDNLNVFLKACGRLGLKEAQLFHPGDLQDLSTRVTVKHQETDRRLKNVLITIYWLGRRAQSDRFYDGPYLNLKAFEGLLGTALYKALQESPGQKSGSVRDSGFGDSWYSEREEPHHLRGGGGGGGRGHRREDSLDSVDSLGSQPHSISSDTTLKGSSEGCFSDTEADSAFRMAESKDGLGYRRSLVITPKPNTQFNQFLPSKEKSSGYVPAPLRKKFAERKEDSRRSSAYLSSAEEEVKLTRSKSTSDIQIDPAVSKQVRYEELQKFREKVKENEDQWQDDLSKWKNRRRSVNSDIVKKKEEREKIEQTYGGDRVSKTLKDMQEERENKRKDSIGSRISLSYLNDDGDVFEKPASTRRTRTLPPRSYTVDALYSSSESFEPALKAEKPPAPSPPPPRAASPPASREVKISDSLVGSSSIAPASHSSADSSASPAAVPPLQRSQAIKDTGAAKREEAASAVSSSSLPQAVPEPRRPLLGKQTEAEAPSDSLSKQQAQLGSMESKPPEVSRVSTSVPRGYQRSDSARLTSGFTPRPFVSQPPRIMSLPRAFTMDDSQKRVNGNVDVSKKTSVPSRYHQFMTSEDEAHSSSAQSSEEEEEEEEREEEKTTEKGVTLSQSISSVTPHVKREAPESPAPAKETSQVKENFCEMRISLNQKPNSSRDFGFHATWDSTGARVTSIQPGSPAEMCQLQAGDEVLTVNGHKVAEMSYAEWKSCNEEALHEGSLVMDIRRHGQNNWDRNQPSLPYKSHKTINLTSTDHPILLGSPETNAATSSLDFTSNSSADVLATKDSPARTVVDVASNGVNGGFREEAVTMRNKDSEPISLKNFKRRSEFFEQGGSESSALVYLCGKTGGSESVMPDIPVPPITPTSSRWSWDPEEERKRQEKWQKEQERLLQEKYKRDQEKLQEEWLQAQKDIGTSVNEQEPGSLRVNSHKVPPYSPSSPGHQPTPPLWEEEERKRQAEREHQRQEEEERRRRREEEERELQRVQEERRMREEEERELQRVQEERRRREEEERELLRLQEERKRKEMQEEEERKKREEEEERWQRRREEEREEERRRQEAAEQQRRDRALEQQQWAGGFAGFASVQAPLSFTDRTKSKSSPQLDEEDKPQRRGAHVHSKDRAQWHLEEQLRIARGREIQRTVSELQMRQRNSLNAMRNREPDIGTAAGSGVAEKRGQQTSSQAELERQQILNEMKKKTPLLTDSSWIRQNSPSNAADQENEVPPMRRGESLDNLETYNSRRASWTSRSSSFAQNYSRPQPGLPGSSSFYTSGSGAQRPVSSTLPSSYSMSSFRSGAGSHSSSWSRQSSSPSHSSLSSPEPTSDTPEQRSRSVSGKKICTFCDTPLGKGAAMIIESLGLCYHLSCFKCIDCKADLGGSEAGAEVRIRNKQLYCNSCYMRFKAGHPTAM